MTTQEQDNIKQLIDSGDKENYAVALMLSYYQQDFKMEEFASIFVEKLSRINYRCCFDSFQFKLEFADFILILECTEVRYPSGCNLTHYESINEIIIDDISNDARLIFPVRKLTKNIDIKIGAIIKLFEIYLSQAGIKPKDEIFKFTF